MAQNGLQITPKTDAWAVWPLRDFFCCLDFLMENTQEEGDLFCTPTTQKLPAPTVDGRNPAPFGMYKTFVNNGDKLPTSTGAGFLPSTV